MYLLRKSFFRFYFLILFGIAAYLAFVSYAFAGSHSRTDVIRMGSVLCLTGPGKAWGEQFQTGASLAVEEINRSGAGPRLELIYKDSQTAKDIGKEKVLELSYSGIQYIAEIMATGIMTYCLDTITNKRMLVLSGVNTGPALTWGGGEYFFRIVPSDVVAANQLTAWATEMGHKRAAILYDQSDWGLGVSQAAEKEWEARGGTVVIKRDVVKGQAGLGPIIDAIRAKDSDVVFLFTYPRESALLLKEARRKRLKAVLMGTDNFIEGVAGLAHDAAIGALFVMPGKSENESTAKKKFFSLFSRRYGKDKAPSVISMYAYDVVRVLYDVARNAGHDMNKAVSALETGTWDGVTGKIAFDRNHDVKVRQYQRMVFKKTLDEGIEAVPYMSGN